MKHMIRKHGNKEMTIATVFYLMVQRSETEFGFHRTKGILQIKQHGEGIEYLFFGKPSSIGSEDIISAGVIHLFHAPVDVDRIFRLLILFHTNLIAPGDTAMLFFQSSDFFQNFLILFGPPFSGKCVSNLRQVVLKALLKAGFDAFFLYLLGTGVTINFHFVGTIPTNE